MTRGDFEITAGVLCAGEVNDQESEKGIIQRARFVYRIFSLRFVRLKSKYLVVLHRYLCSIEEGQRPNSMRIRWLSLAGRLSL